MGDVASSRDHIGKRSARALFAVRLAELWKAAGNPTLRGVASAAEARMRAAQAPGRGGSASAQRISDWRAGRNVPSRFESFEPVLLILIRLAESAPSPAPPVLLNRLAWRHLWKAASEEPDPAGAPTAFPQPRIAMTALLRDIGTFVGRDIELRRILDAAGQSKVVSVQSVDGMAGVGKTALVTRAAHMLSSRYPDGRFFVELNAHTRGQTPADPFDVLGRLLTDLGIAPGHIPDSLDTRRDLWLDRLAGKRVLLVLDDARDHAQIEPLLPAGTDCLTLITSRRRLVALDGALPLTLDTLDPESSVELFYLLAQRRPSDVDLTAAAEIVRSCGYLPLAIVLLAGRLAHHPTWTLTGVAEEFAANRDRLSELDAGDRAVRAAFAMSYQNLPPDQQRLFRRLGMHPGPALDAYAVAALEGITLTAACRGLEALYTDHLIDEITPGRYRLHDLLREYAQSLAAADPVEDSHRAVDRLLNYYRHTAITAISPTTAMHPASPSDSALAPVPEVSTYASASAWMGVERANLMACLEFAASNNRLSDVIDLTNALTGELRLQCPWQTAVVSKQRTGAAGQTISDLGARGIALADLGTADYLADDYSVAADLLQRVLENRGGIDDPAVRALALRTLAWTRFLAADYTIAATLFEEALAIDREVADRSGEFVTLNMLAWLKHVTGDYCTAIGLLQQALTIDQDLGNRFGEAIALCQLGWLHYLTTDDPAAADMLQRAAEIYRDTGHRAEEAFANFLLAWVHCFRRDYETGTELLQLVLTIYRQLEHRSGEAFALNNLAWMKQMAGNYRVAADFVQQALAIYREVGNRSGEASALKNLGRVHCLAGEYAAAAALLPQALTLYQSVGNRIGEAEALGDLGWVRYSTGDYSAAADLMQRALTIFRRVNHRSGVAESLNRIGALLIGSGDLRQALATYDEALSTARNIQNPLEQARALEGSARCRVHLGLRARAKADLREAVTLYESIGAPETESAATYLAELSS
ncbi:tetratricopeptide repeat protein [Nocardia transvalensis]|uniref:tetratricopeptide repeat protein n=1 Tax=Nocardia transvalensis TaxID=37333 RepID=UPI001893312E|nr:tetratricopeptide repeat protein [Nocardia transvalensis]MBF6332979.1 tetratricopeptide repeat protein [Nocardia transvalensis]